MPDMPPSVPIDVTSNILRTPMADEKLSALHALLSDVDDDRQSGFVAKRRPAIDTAIEMSSIGGDAELTAAIDQLVQARLGIASSIFTALRAKHVPTASHSLRVALTCSGWAIVRELSEEQSSTIEVAALLHDVGKIGVPDDVLRKPAALDNQETVLIRQHWATGLDILSACGASQELLDIVQYTRAWYDGSRDGSVVNGAKLPLGARMLAIADAFDAMTTDQVYRRANSKERALYDVLQHAGTQFDPALAKEFYEWNALNVPELQQRTSQRWLAQLDPDLANSRWRMGQRFVNRSADSSESLFDASLYDQLDDGVVFVDVHLRILRWNQAVEKLTGLTAAGVEHKTWFPSLVDLRDDEDITVQDDACPVSEVIQTGMQKSQQVSVAGRGDTRKFVVMRIIPVVENDGTKHGATIVLHDITSEQDLQERVQDLHRKATRDPLTKVPNRAEFDQTHRDFVADHMARNQPCSLIVCDIDRFKKVNDTYGHQVGDVVLVSFAALLQRCCRCGDLVARYGGEEFVMVCGDCDNATAAARAERIRIELANTIQPALNNSRLTASFGVTELQPGDTPESMFRRADRAVYKAKAMGRNTVVQLGCGMSGESPEPISNWWSNFWLPSRPELLMEKKLVTGVPIEVVIEKLRGFVVDHDAEIASVTENLVLMNFEGSPCPQRRSSDRMVPMIVEIVFKQQAEDLQAKRANGESLLVRIRPRRNRDRQLDYAPERAAQLYFSLKSYLMAQEFAASPAADDEDGSGP